MTSNIKYITDRQAAIPLEGVRRLFRYNKKTGILYKRSGSKWVKQTTRDDCGYFVTSFKDKHLMVHRVIWALVYGKWPVALIDHVNRVKDDNRIINLRNANHQRNTYNSKTTNKLGFKGISEHINLDGTKRYTARLSIKGTTITGGAWDSPEKAHEAYLRLRANYITFDSTLDIPPFTEKQQFDHMMSAAYDR